MKYRAIKDNAGRFAVNVMCSALGIWASGYYAWLRRPQSATAQTNRQLTELIREIHTHDQLTDLVAIVGHE